MYSLDDCIALRTSPRAAQAPAALVAAVDLVMGQAASFAAHVKSLLASIAASIVAPLRASDLRRLSARLSTHDDEGTAMLASDALAAVRCAQEMYRCARAREGGGACVRCLPRRSTHVGAPQQLGRGCR